MSELVLPKIEMVEGDDAFGHFIADPLEKGFGVTLGNALRRVLLSFLPGAAVTKVIIEGIQHEFSTIPHVKEDTMELLLNVKALRIKALASRAGKLILEVTGEKKVYASDIHPSMDFEITNPDLYLATLDSPEARLSIELDIDLGRGYCPADSGDSLAVGTIPLDAIFTPIIKVDFRIEPIHVGRETSQEKLHLEVRTDGTISPADALSQAANILVGQFGPFAGFGQLPSAEEEEEKEAVSIDIPQEKYNMPVEQMDLSVRTMNCLRHAGITTIGEVIEKGEKELMGLRNFGQKSLVELRERFTALGLSLAEEKPEEEPEAKKKKKKKAAASAGESE